jgi:predicted unusual protein kinase regulating ubiquinone biosynthesis (AarF/ABC1/UbiB family)
MKQRPIDRPGIMASLPRREFIITETTEVSPPMMQTVTFPVNYPRALQRLFVWFFIGISLFLGNFWDWLRRKSSQAHRAIRLRRIFENAGGITKKIGQLLAMRIDLLPWAYCVELSKIVDQMSPFPVKQAIERIERATKLPLSEVFSQFDPEPILSTSAACVYQAYLKGGEKVAVKVRRPGVGELFMADFKVLDWILDISEFLSILRPGFTQNLRRDFRETIQDELNFLLEARNQSLFRREAKKTGKTFFTAPRVFFELCDQRVIIQEFTTGMWLWELIAAVERDDPDAKARAFHLNIDPKVVAKRLMWVNFWELDEHLLFRADLDPDNVIVRKNSKITFIDFNSVGALTREKRQALQQTMEYARKRDTLGMAQASMVLLEPLPPVDLVRLTKDLEARYLQFIYPLESDEFDWWERTTARLWLGFVEVARDHNITMNIHVLRMLRASLLYGTIAARIHPKIDHIKEYQKFSNYRAKKARERVGKRVKEQFRRGLDAGVYLQMEEIVDTSQRLFREFHRLLSTPVFKFNAVIGKSVFSLSILFRLLGHVGITTLITAGIILGTEWIANGQVLYVGEMLSRVVSNHAYQLVLIILVIINFRNILFRLGDKEI